MHRVAEAGIAAHWKYKEGKGYDEREVNRFAWLRQLLEWQREVEDPDEFLEGLRYDLGTSETFVFTPRGDVMALTAGATPVDFAYAVHTEIGHRCIGARVNGKLVPLESKLNNGDVVRSSPPSPTVPVRVRIGCDSWLRRGRAARFGPGSPGSVGRRPSRGVGEQLARALRRRGLPVAQTVDGPS
jgi:molybdopterin converting factor small subunit